VNIIRRKRCFLFLKTKKRSLKGKKSGFVVLGPLKKKEKKSIADDSFLFMHSNMNPLMA
jgi:hypothetical protein